MTKDWLIKRVPTEVYDAIKEKTKDMGCTIPELLRFTFCDGVKKERPATISWKIKAIDENVVNAIKKNAVKSNVSVGDYLKGLLATKRVTFDARDAQANLVKKFKGQVREFIKTLDFGG